MSLDRVLELSEANMNEGDYLEVANILRDVHNNTPPPERDLQKTIILNETHIRCKDIDCECFGNTIYIKSIKFERNNSHSYWLPKEVDVDDKIINWSRLGTMITQQLKASMSLDISFYTDSDNENMDFDFEKYVKFYTKRYEIVNGDLENFPDDESIYNDFICLIESQITSYLVSLRHSIE